MIDIIIPVYNTPIKDLERCLNSILKQNYSNYIVYIIDDGSNDETKIFLDEYTKEKGNFIVTHIPNQGVSHARNIGIDISKNKYIAFIDSDDTIENDFLNESITLMENNNLDLIVGGYNEIKNNEITRTRLCLPGLHIYEQNKDLFFEKLLTSKANENTKEIGDCPTGRIYTRVFRRESIGKLRFNEKIGISEDTLFMIDYMYQVKKIGIIDRVWYNYYINDYSISNGSKKKKLIKNIDDFIDEMKVRMNKEDNTRIKKAYQARIEKALSFQKN